MAAGDNYTEGEKKAHQLEVMPDLIQAVQWLLDVVKDEPILKKKVYEQRKNGAVSGLDNWLKEYSRDTRPYTLLDYAEKQSSEMLPGVFSSLYGIGLPVVKTEAEG